MLSWQPITRGTRTGTSHNLYAAGPRSEPGSEPCHFCCSTVFGCKTLGSLWLSQQTVSLISTECSGSQPLVSQPGPPGGAYSNPVLPGPCPGPRQSGGPHTAGRPGRPPPPLCKLVIAVWSDQKELDKPSRNFILILQMKMETCPLKSRQLCQQAGLRQQET